MIFKITYCLALLEVPCSVYFKLAKNPILYSAKMSHKNYDIQLQMDFQTHREYFAAVKYRRHHPAQQQCHHIGP